MEQMGNILLGKSSQLGSVSTGDTSASGDPGTFLSTLNQVSEFQSGKLAVPNTKASFSMAQASGLTNRGASEANDTLTDVDLILSQIDLAGMMNLEDVEATGSASAIIAVIESVGTSEPSITVAESVGTSELIIAVAESVEISELIAAEQYNKQLDAVGNDLPPELILGAIDPRLLDDPQGITDITGETIDFLAQLDADSQGALALFADKDLSELSPEELAALLEEYNAQALANDKPAIPLPESMMAWLRAQSEPLQPAAQQTAIDAVLDDSAEPAMGAQSIPRDKVQAAVLPQDKWHILGGEPLQENKLASGSDAQSVTHADLKQADLKKADFGVTLETLAANAKQGLATNTDGDALGESIASDMPQLEIKTLQNQSSFTPMHKSDVPQFQLSLRQGGEAGGQMQEMIQKFAPVMQQQLITMVSKGIQQAEIRLDPPELGHMLVKIQVHGDQTQVQFQVAHAQTKELVEQALPKLREMLAQEGMQLADSQVSQGNGGREQKEQQQEEGGRSHSQLDDNPALETNLSINHTSGLNSAIDYYA